MSDEPKVGRPLQGDAPMTSTERARRSRAARLRLAVPELPVNSAVEPPADRVEALRAAAKALPYPPTSKPLEPPAMPATLNPKPKTAREQEIAQAKASKHALCPHCKEHHAWRERCESGKYVGLNGPEMMDLFAPGGPLQGCTDSRPLTADDIAKAVTKMRRRIEAEANTRHKARRAATALHEARQGTAKAQ